MYRSPNLARLAGAVSLPAALALWGLGYLFIVGETTVTTWALGLTFAFSATVVLVVAVRERPEPTGTEYVDGFMLAVVALAVTYLGLLAFDLSLVRAVASVGRQELLAVLVSFGLLGSVLATVDRRYVDRPESARALEASYLENPNAGD
ncbi:hypothetical protein [Halorarius litoreus]|uniref:hypothetical protein n=1 Tax=Halorarius litoreus TaxID=2962676 RepID=UPI0020CF6463|nr:hypothetical protein [Halorarius litoreus]